MKYRVHPFASLPEVLKILFFSSILAILAIAVVFALEGLLSRLQATETVSCSSSTRVELRNGKNGAEWTKSLVRVNGDSETPIVWAHDPYLGDFADIQSLWGCSQNWVLFTGTLKGTTAKTFFAVDVQYGTLKFAGQVLKR